VAAFAVLLIIFFAGMAIWGARLLVDPDSFMRWRRYRWYGDAASIRLNRRGRRSARASGTFVITVSLAAIVWFGYLLTQGVGTPPGDTDQNPIPPFTPHVDISCPTGPLGAAGCVGVASSPTAGATR
jgi:TRAP-type C4-dicarboxylate transport system permease small subunit